jgi:DNA polymerase-3 subunit beta
VKLSATARALSEAISLASAIKPGANSPSVAHLAPSSGSLSIRCTDTMGTIVTTCSAMVHEPGETAVSLARLGILVATFTADAVLEIETGGTTLNVVSGTSRLRLPTVSVAGLPMPIAIGQEIGSIEISTADCLKLLQPIAVADEARCRSYLGGVFWHSQDDQLVAVATDGVRLIRQNVVASMFSKDRDLIVPTGVAVVARRLIQRSRAERVGLRRSRTLIAFEGPGFTFAARLLDAGYPAYERFIPAPSSNAVVCDRLKLLAAVSRLSAAAPGIEPLLALAWKEGSNLDLHLARCPLDGADVVAADAHGCARVALSLAQFALLLEEFNSEHIRLETANEQPVVMRGAGNKLALIVRSKWNFDSSRLDDCHTIWTGVG